MSALVTSEIFRLFVNTLTPDDKYSRRYMQSFWQQVQTPLSQKGETFWRFFIEFLKCAWNLEHSEKEKEYPRVLLRKLLHPKEMFTKASKRSCFSRPFGNQRVNRFETLLKSTRHHYFPLFPRIRDKLSWKQSALVTSEIFRLFVNTLTPHEKYSRRYMQTLWQQVETLLSQKERDFFKIFYWISEICMKFRTFWKKRRVS